MIIVVISHHQFDADEYNIFHGIERSYDDVLEFVKGYRKDGQIEITEEKPLFFDFDMLGGPSGGNAPARVRKYSYVNVTGELSCFYALEYANSTEKR